MVGRCGGERILVPKAVVICGGLPRVARAKDTEVGSIQEVGDDPVYMARYGVVRGQNLAFEFR